MTTDGGSAAPQLLILSEASESALDQVASRLREFLLEDGAARIGDVAYTLQAESRELAHRRMLVCSGREDAISVLGDKNPNRLLSGRVEEPRRAVVFMLPGIGDQYVGMGYRLYRSWDVFREAVDRCAHILEPHLGIDIRTVLYPASRSWKQAATGKGIDLKRMLGRSADDRPDPDTSRLNTTLFAQPALFTIEYALATLWLSLGVKPDALVGHSMGEYVAACLAEVLSLEDALRLIAVRARLVNALPEAVMLATMLPEEELRPILPPGLFISLINGPGHCVVAGPPAEVAVFEETLKRREVIARRVQNGHAFHTSMLQPVLQPFEAEVRKVSLREPAIPYLSNVTGDWVTASQARDPSYWVMHAAHTARFSDGLRRMWRLQNPALIECGPGKTLNMLAAQHPDRKGTLRGAIWSMRQRYENEQDEQVLLGAIGKVWLAGGAIDWNEIPRSGESRRIPLPACVATAVAPCDVEGASCPSGVDADRARDEGDAAAGGWTDDDSPANDRERQLLEIWKTALGRDRIGVNDSFGALGGDSLSSVGAVLEMKRLGIPDEIARGLYTGLTIRQMAQMETAGGSVSSGRRIALSSIDTPIFIRALAIYWVVASHLGLTDLFGNPALMIVSGLNFAKFQLQTVEKEASVKPIFRLILRVAVPCVLWMVFSQLWWGTLSIRSWFFVDNFAHPMPFSAFESPWFVDLLFQCWLLVAIALSVRAVRQFAIKRTYLFGLAFLAVSWAASVIIPLLVDPRRNWKTPDLYLWLMALGWCAAYSRSDREKIITSVVLVALSALNAYCDVSQILAWHTVVAGLAIIWLDELPLQLPRPLMEMVVAVAGGSLFIYLSDVHIDDILHRHLWPGRPPIVGVAWCLLAGVILWKLWNIVSRIALKWGRKLGVRQTDLSVGTADG